MSAAAAPVVPSEPPSTKASESAKALPLAEARPRRMSDAENFIMQLQKRVTKFFNWMGPSQRDSSRAHVIRGFLKSALVYLVPITLLRRKLEFSSVRRAVALGTFVAGVRAVDHVLEQMKVEAASASGSEDYQMTNIEKFIHKYTLGVAGFVSALIAVTIDGEVATSSVFTIWAVIRALRCVIPDIPFGPVLGMVLAGPFILPPYVFAPDELHPSYSKFLLIHGGQSKDKVKTIREAGLPQLCEVLHPGMSCYSHVPHFFLESLPRSLKVYVPVFLLAFLFSNKRNVWYTLENIIRSATFLSTYCTMAWFSSCMWTKFDKSPQTQLKFMKHCWFAGFATAIERPGRQAELAAYCITYAVDRIFRFLEKRKYVELSPSLNALLLSVAGGMVLYHRDQQPQMLIKFLFALSSK